MKKRIFSILLMLLVAFTLVACKKDPKPEEDPIKQKFDEVVETLNGLVSKPDEVKNDLTLPKTFRHGITGEWKSSDDKLLALTVGDTTVAGKVSRPDHDEGNKKVTLSIELVLVEDDKEHTRNWSLELTIIALDPPASTETYTSFKDAYDALIDGEFKLDNFRTGTLEFEGVKLYGTTTSGQYVATSDGTIAYIHGSTPKFEAGKTYNATAKLYDYFGFIQLDGVNISESDEDIEVDVNFAEKSIAEIVKLPLPNVDGHRVYPETWVLKDVKFLIDKTMSSESYNLVIVDKDFDPETAERSEDGDNYYKDSVMAYYVVHDYNQLKALEGTVISELEVIYEGYRDDKHVHYVTVLSIDDHVHLELTDELKVDLAKAGLEIETNFRESGTLAFPTEGAQGTEIAWSYKDSDNTNNELVDFELGTITTPEEGRVTVEVVATISSGEVSDTKTFKIFIGEHVDSTVQQALEASKGVELKVTGVITDLFAANTYGFTDEAGDSIAIYTSNVKLTTGLEYTLIGTKDDFNGLHQLKNIEVEAEKQPTFNFEVKDITDIIDDNNALKPYIASRVKVTGAEVVKVGEVDAKHNNITVKVKVGEKELDIRYDSRTMDGGHATKLEELNVGDSLDYIGNLGWYNGPQLGYGYNTIVRESGEHTEETLAVIDFDDMSGDKGKSLKDNELKELLEELLGDDSNMLVKVLNTDRIYKGNGSGGGSDENRETIIKTGTGSDKGVTTLVFNKHITKVKLTVRGWGDKDTVTINGVKKTLANTYGVVEFEFENATNTLNFLFENRALIEKIELLG